MSDHDHIINKCIDNGSTIQIAYHNVNCAKEKPSKTFYSNNIKSIHLEKHTESMILGKNINDPDFQLDARSYFYPTSADIRRHRDYNQHDSYVTSNLIEGNNDQQWSKHQQSLKRKVQQTKDARQPCTPKHLQCTSLQKLYTKLRPIRYKSTRRN